MFTKLKHFLDSDEFILFALSGLKSEKQAERVANSYLVRFIIFLRYRKVFKNM